MKFPESPRVRYSRNPLVEVICQLRFPKILSIETETPVEFQEAVRSEYPILQTSRSLELPFLSNSQLTLPAMIGQGLVYEFIDKKEEWKLALSSDFIALSTLNYRKWEDFRAKLSAVIELLVKHYNPSHFTRVGLRYQDLIIRSELELQNSQWRNLLQPPILGTFLADNLPEQDFIEALSVFACRLDYNDAILRVRYGLARKNEVSEEPGYLIDSDFYTDKLTEITDANRTLEQFNRESGNFFRWCITEELRKALKPQPIEGE
jgi:uncharacterized protein (TIGR04255 family)